MCNMQELSLSSNNISDPGLAALADVLGKGALAQLTTLRLGRNQIGDAGLSSLAAAVGNGALPKLEVLFISSPSAELTALCSSKSIKLNTY